MRGRRIDLLIALAIVASIFTAYWRVTHFDFIGFDDGAYVSDNANLRDGLLSHNLKWIFLSLDPDNWFPVTRASLLLDYKLFGLRAAPYHVENLILHSVAAMLLFGFLRQATGRRWPSAFVAFVFALHPLHVESVAWISERKDSLCALFWFATLWAWTRYAERPSRARYAGALALFGLGLMSKPMIVTLPLLLVLLEVWPLRRGFSRRLVLEKVPFAVGACALMVVTIAAQRYAGAIQALHQLPLSLRAENALVTVAVYVADTLWPARLWAIYSYPRSLPVWQVLMAAAGIVAISVLVLPPLRSRAYLAVGWFWFLGTLIPVIGLLQVGPQARADRYMYVPMVGLAIMLAWAAAELVERWPRLRLWAAALATFACLAMATKSWAQTAFWSDSEVLLRHAIAMDSQNYQAWSYLGQIAGRESDAIDYFRTGLQIRPEDPDLHHGLAKALFLVKRREEAVAEYQDAIWLNPASALIHYDFGQALATMERPQEAIAELETAVRLDPQFAAARSDLGAALWKIPSRAAEGLRHLEKAVEIDSGDARTQSNLGHALLNTPNRLEDSAPHFNQALRINPALGPAHAGLAVYFRRKGMELEAQAHAQASQRLKLQR